MRAHRRQLPRRRSALCVNARSEYALGAPENAEPISVLSPLLPIRPDVRTYGSAFRAHTSDFPTSVSLTGAESERFDLVTSLIRPSAPPNTGRLEQQGDLFGGERLGDILEGDRVLDDVIEVRYFVVTHPAGRDRRDVCPSREGVDRGIIVSSICT
jgi:hypothetical protein